MGFLDKVKKAASGTKSVEGVPTFEVTPPTGNGLCSDDQCPCLPPGTVIPRGEGYLYISKDVVDFRHDALSLADAERKLKRMRETFGGVVLFSPGIVAPILMCEQGARRRKLDMKVAAEDATRWWETGQVPLRVTPLAA